MEGIKVEDKDRRETRRFCANSIIFEGIILLIEADCKLFYCVYLIKNVMGFCEAKIKSERVLNAEISYSPRLFLKFVYDFTNLLSFFIKVFNIFNH